MAPSRQRYSSDSSPSESSSEDEWQRRRSGRDRHSVKNKAYSSSDESSDSERDRVKARGSKVDGGRGHRRRHYSDDEEADRKVAPRVSSRDGRRGRGDRGERNKKKSYSSDESDERGRRRYDSDDEETERRRRRRILDDRGDREHAGQVSDDKKERAERSRKDGEDRGADLVRRNVEEEPEGKKERSERSRKDEDDRREHARRNEDKEIEEQKDRRERSRKDEGDRRERVRRNAVEDRREMSRKDVDGDDGSKRDRDERKLDRERSRSDANDDNKLERDERKLDRECSRRDGDDDSMEEGELVDKKDERVKNREREQRAESPCRRDRYLEGRRHRDDDGKKSRDKGRSSSEDEKRDDRARKRDRESSPQRRDRKRVERRHRDGDGGSPRRKERNGDDYSRRHMEKEKSREKDAKEEGKKEESAPIQQMPDAGVIKTGGIYIPPHRMAQMMREVQDKSSEQYQRLSWDALKKSINGLVNKVNAANIKNIIPELFSENLIRGRGLFCRSCMKSQMTSPGFTDVFAALVAVVNTKFPEVGKLILKRIVLQLRRAYKRNDKPQLLAATKFIAHLVNQQVAHEIIALELLTLLLETPTDDSVEVAVGFVKECGALLQDFSPQGLHGIFERFRGILHEGEIDKRVQFLIEGLFAIRKAKFQGFPAIRPELDLVEQEDQFTHEVSLEDEIDPETSLDVFKANPLFLEDEKAYEDVKKSILGDESSDDEEGSDAVSEDEDEDESEEDDDESMKIKDETETNLVNLRRTIYLTIMSSVDFEEAGHKLLKIKLEPGQEMELCIMLLECCSQERTYLRYYGLLGQRFCMINKVYQENFEKNFVQQYSMIHRLETNKLRNVAKFFAHLLGTNALPWHVLAYIRLTEEDTTSSSRIFIKILFQELSEHLGIRLLNERLNDPMMQDSFESIFPKDNPKNTRFAINFFTSIGLGGITESLREYLKNMPRLIMQQQKPVSESDDDSGSSSASSSGSSSSESDSSSESESDSSSDKRERRDRHSKRRRRN